MAQAILFIYFSPEATDLSSLFARLKSVVINHNFWRPVCAHLVVMLASFSRRSIANRLKSCWELFNSHHRDCRTIAVNQREKQQTTKKKIEKFKLIVSSARWRVVSCELCMVCNFENARYKFVGDASQFRVISKRENLHKKSNDGIKLLF